MFIVGYVVGPMAWGPLSESYGRKGVMMYSFALLTVFSIASAVAPNFAALVIFRLLVGIGGSAAISVVGGICADIYHDPISRGRSMAIFMVSCGTITCEINRTTADTYPGSDNFWTHSWTGSLWLRLSRKMELAILDRRHSRGRDMAARRVLPRDIRPRDPKEARAATTQGDRRRKHSSATGARKDRPEAYRDSRALAPPTDDMFRANRALHLLVLKLRL